MASGGPSNGSDTGGIDAKTMGIGSDKRGRGITILGSSGEFGFVSQAVFDRHSDEAFFR